MRVVLDTNLIVSALIAPAGTPASMIQAWLDGRFTLLTSAAHFEGVTVFLRKKARQEQAREPDCSFGIARVDDGNAQPLKIFQVMCHHSQAML